MYPRYEFGLIRKMGLFRKFIFCKPSPILKRLAHSASHWIKYIRKELIIDYSYTSETLLAPFS